MSDVDVNIENASKYGLSFNNSPTTKPSDMIFTGVDWGSGTLTLDAWAGVLRQDVLQDGNTYSVRSRYRPDGDSYEALWDFAYLLNNDIVLEISSFEHIYDDFLDSLETTGNILTGDKIVQLLLTGNDWKIFEALFSGNDIFDLGNGNDVVYGYGGNDVIYGNGGNDRIHTGFTDGQYYRDEAYGGDGDDTIIVFSGEGIIDGGSGNDTIYSDIGWQANVQGGDGDDLFHNLRGFIYGGNGEDTVTHWRDSKNYALSKSPSDNIITVTYYTGSVYTVADSVESFQFRDITISKEDVIYTGDYSPVVVTSVDPVYRFYNTRDKAFFYTSSPDERDYVIQNSLPKYINVDYSEAGTITLHRYITNFGTARHFEEPRTDFSGTYEGTMVMSDRTNLPPPTASLPSESIVFYPDSDGADASWPYVYQGSTFEAAHSYLSSSALAPVFRFYNYETGHHFFTVSEAESDMIKGKIASGEWPFNYEGTGFSVYSADPTPGYQGQEIAVARYYSPTLNRHFFTADQAEATQIALTGVWNFEGIAFWGEDLG